MPTERRHGLTSSPSSLVRLLPIALAVAALCACGGGATSAPDPLPPHDHLAPRFAAVAGPDALVLSGELIADGREQVLPEGARLIAVIGETRTPLASGGHGEPFSYPP